MIINSIFSADNKSPIVIQQRIKHLGTEKKPLGKNRLH